MSRSLSTAAKNAIFAQETSSAFLLTLTIDHDDLDDPLRFVNDNQDITFDGDVYTAYPFLIDLPADTGEEISRVTLTIDNVDRQIVETIRELTTAPSVDLEVLHQPYGGSATKEAGPFSFTLKDSVYDVLVVTGTLSYEDILDEPFPGDTFSPPDFPGLF